MRVQFAGRSGFITALFRLHNFLCDEKVKPVNTSEEDGDSGRDRPKLTEEDTLSQEFQTNARTAPTRSGDVAARMALRMTLDNKREYCPLENQVRNKARDS